MFDGRRDVRGQAREEGTKMEEEDLSICNNS
jgi:hypothetical protein